MASAPPKSIIIENTWLFKYDLHLIERINLIDSPELAH